MRKPTLEELRFSRLVAEQSAKLRPHYEKTGEIGGTYENLRWWLGLAELKLGALYQDANPLPNVYMRLHSTADLVFFFRDKKSYERYGEMLKANEEDREWNRTHPVQKTLRFNTLNFQQEISAAWPLDVKRIVQTVDGVKKRYLEEFGTLPKRPVFSYLLNTAPLIRDQIIVWIQFKQDMKKKK